MGIVGGTGARNHRADIQGHGLSVIPVILLNLGLTALTEAQFTGDAPDFADSIATRLQGRSYDWWDPGHLLWRPLGLLATG